MDTKRFTDDVAVLKTTTPWKNWVATRSGAADAAILDTWVKKLVSTGTVPPQPTVATTFGKRIIDSWGALAFVQPTPPSPPPIPTPTPTPTPLGPIDDMRATHMQALSSEIVENTAGLQDRPPVDAAGNPMGPGYTNAAGYTSKLGYIAVRSQTPPLWDSMLETNDDVTLVPDPDYGQVYRYRVNGQSHNPYWSSPTTCNTSLVKSRPLSIGQTDWYWLGVMWEPGWDWTKVDWQTVFQIGYPTISSPPLGIFAGGDRLYIPTVTGLINASRPYGDYGGYIFDTHAKYIGHMLEFVLGVGWSSHLDGMLDLYTRCRGLGETKFKRATILDEGGWPPGRTFPVTGVNTWQWGGSLAVPQDPSKYNVEDKLDSYLGYKPGTTDDNMPSMYVRHTGHVRCASMESALAVAA